MAFLSSAVEGRWAPPAGAASAQRYARATGVLFLVSLLAGGFGETFVPSRLVVSADAVATARNLVASQWLFRAGFAGYLVEALCDVALTLCLYVLLAPVRADMALLAAFLRLVSTAVFAIAEFFYFSASLVLRGDAYLQTFSPDQLSTLALLLVKLSGYAGGLFLVFYGVASLLLGYLIYRSGYLPRLLGVLLALGGLGFVTKSFTLVLAPAYSSNVLLLPVVLAGLALTVWLLVKGVDVSRWEAAGAASASEP